MVILKLLGSKMEYNKKEQLLDKVSGLKYMNPSGQGFYHNKALDNACVHIKEFFDSEFVPEVPQYVANWYEINKFDLEFNIWSYIFNWKDQSGTSFKTWMDYTSNNPIQTLINMRQFGYKVEKEKKYLVKFKNIQSGTQYLKYDKVIEKWYFGIEQGTSSSLLHHTKEELISGGFEWVLSCEGVEIEEVKDE